MGSKNIMYIKKSANKNITKRLIYKAILPEIIDGKLFVSSKLLLVESFVHEFPKKGKFIDHT